MNYAHQVTLLTESQKQTYIVHFSICFKNGQSTSMYIMKKIVDIWVVISRVLYLKFISAFSGGHFSEGAKDGSFKNSYHVLNFHNDGILLNLNWIIHLLLSFPTYWQVISPNVPDEGRRGEGGVLFSSVLFRIYQKILHPLAFDRKIKKNYPE